MAANTALEGKAADGFRSEGERQIARLLDTCGIQYCYEHPLAVVDRGKTRLWYPDFLLPEYGIIVECVGMRGSRAYDAQLEHKKNLYGQLRVPVVFFKSDSLRGYWPRQVLQRIEQLLEERLDRFRQLAGEGILGKS